jgi:hypothetical protein
MSPLGGERAARFGQFAIAFNFTNPALGETFFNSEAG